MLLSISGCSDVGSATLGCSPNSSLTIRGDDFTYFNTARPGYEPLAFSISFTVPRAVFGARTWYFTFSNRSMPHNQTIVVQLAPTAQWGDLLTAWFTNVDVPQPVWMRTSEFITNTVNISFKTEADVVVSSLVPCTTIPAAGKLPGITAMDLLGAYVLEPISVTVGPFRDGAYSPAGQNFYLANFNNALCFVLPAIPFPYTANRRYDLLVRTDTNSVVIPNALSFPASPVLSSVLPCVSSAEQ